MASLRGPARPLLLAAAASLLAVGCSAPPAAAPRRSGGPAAGPAPSAGALVRHSALLHFSGGLFGTLRVPPGQLICGPGRGTVLLLGTVGGSMASVSITHAPRRGTVLLPPPGGGIRASVLVIAYPPNGPSVSYYAGPRPGGSAAGRGTIAGTEGGRAGRVSLGMTSTSLVQGTLVSLVVGGGWRC